MKFQTIESLSDKRAEIFAQLTESQLRNRIEPEQGIFIAESPKVISRALRAGLFPVALLCEEKHIAGDAAEVINEIVRRNPEATLLTGNPKILSELTGYRLTRGVLCAMRRPAPLPISTLLEGASRVAVLEEISDAVNVGAIIRSAAALGIDAIVLDPQSCDPLNRRVVRVSMGNIFSIKWGVVENPVNVLQEAGFKCAAMALRHDTISLDSPLLEDEPKLAIVLGNEGEGLKTSTISACDYTIKIPMREGVDSLNVAAAAAIAFWQLRKI